MPLCPGIRLSSLIYVQDTVSHLKDAASIDDTHIKASYFGSNYGELIVQVQLLIVHGDCAQLVSLKINLNALSTFPFSSVV